jgi:two-component system KDP operon response regulator KdpE
VWYGSAMSTAARPLSGIGSRRTAIGPHPTAPDEPVLRVGPERWWASSGLDRAMTAAGWRWVTAEEVDRARWLASIRRVALVVVAGDHAFRWRAIEAVRDLADAPLAVVADDPEEVRALVAAGVNLVMPGSEPSDTQLARLSAIVRSADARRGPGVRYLRANDLVVDLWTQQCTRRGESLALSPTEYRLLTFLMTRPAVTMSTSTIIDRVWGHTPADGRNALCIVVNRLRRKLGDDPRKPVFVASIRGRGYRFVANVAEMADSLVDHAARVDVTPLLDSLTAFAAQLAHAEGDGAAADVLVDTLDRAGVADGMAVFRNERERMRLVTARRLPDAWLESVADGVPLDPSYASAHSVLTGEVVQFADVRRLKGRFGATARRLSGEEIRACHFVPIMRDGQTWGHLGLGRDTPSPLDPVTVAYLRALCAAFLLHLDGRRPVGTEQGHRAPAAG